MKKFQELREDLRHWFSKSHPDGGWKRIDSKGKVAGPCARSNKDEPKPKCLSNKKRKQLSKKDRISAVRSKRKYDGDAERKGSPINVSNFGKGKLSESKNKPTNPDLWAQAIAHAKRKFKIFPCVPLNSQALTQQGWKYYKELKIGDNILSYNPTTNKNEWTPILNLHFFKNSPVIRLYKKQTNFDIKCTPDHKWVLEKYNSKYPDNFVEAKNITKNMIIRTSAELNDNGKGLDLKKFLKSDSWVSNVLNMSIPQIQAFFAAGIVYDGHDKGLSRKKDKQTYGFSQKNKDHGLAMEIAAVILGYRVCVKIKKCNTSMLQWTFIRRNTENTINVHKENAGICDVWCPSTKYGTWIMKQNSYICITGNSAYANGFAAKWYKSKGGKWKSEE